VADGGDRSESLRLLQIWVYGNSFEPFLVAVVVPSEANLIKWAKENGIEGDFATIVKDPRAAKYVQGELAKTGKAAKVSICTV
jgi:long-chain acyl-CoA synthetase